MATVLGFVIGILAVICAFGFIIFIHEMGHFLTARSVGIRCPQFAIGFGPSLFGFRWRGTNFAVRAFPLGGYVLMNGEEPGERSEDPWAAAVAYYLGDVEFPASLEKLLQVLEQVPVEERNEVWTEVRDQVAYSRCKEFPNLQWVEGNFHDRSVGSRILVISGGVIMNFIATILLLWSLGPVIGVGAFFNDWSPYVSQAVAESPAFEAGIRPGDLILEVDGKPVATNLEAFHAIGASKGRPVALKLRNREREELALELRPDLRIGGQVFRVGKDGQLTLKQSEEHSELIGKVVASPELQKLLELTQGQVEKANSHYELTFEGTPESVRFPLPEGFSGPRGQIGVLFGLSDIRFEKSLTGTIQSVEKDSPAEKAGLRAGDIVPAIGGLAIESNNGLVAYGSLADPALESISRIEALDHYEFLIVRDGEASQIPIPKAEVPVPRAEAIGIRFLPHSASDWLKAPFSLIAQTLTLPYLIFDAWASERYTGSEIVENMQGPIGIMTLLYQLSDNGILQFLYFVALLNAAIGAFNLLPFPALDGSRLVFLAWAGIRGKALDPSKEARIHLAGLLILLGFVILVSFGDIKRLISSHLFVL